MILDMYFAVTGREQQIYLNTTNVEYVFKQNVFNFIRIITKILPI